MGIDTFCNRFEKNNTKSKGKRINKIGKEKDMYMRGTTKGTFFL